MSSAITFNLAKVKILSFGKELRVKVCLKQIPKSKASTYDDFIKKKHGAFYQHSIVFPAFYPFPTMFSEDFFSDIKPGDHVVNPFSKEKF